MFRTLSLSLLLACSCGLANAQTVDDGGVSGELRSFAQDTLGPPVTLFEVPAGNTYALTAACLFGTSAVLSGQTFGVIARGAGCVNYSPGLVITEGDQIVCEAGAAGALCVVTGILVDQVGASDEKP
jgi:hypothetical protein